MKRTLSLAVLLVFAAVGLGGCVIHPGHSHRGRAVSSAPNCHPSQYWDGHQCRHKGKGHGARKHDGR